MTSDRQAVDLRLPHAALDKPNLDHQRSYVFAEERGILVRVRAFSTKRRTSRLSCTRSPRGKLPTQPPKAD